VEVDEVRGRSAEDRGGDPRPPRRRSFRHTPAETAEARFQNFDLGGGEAGDEVGPAGNVERQAPRSPGLAAPAPWKEVGMAEELVAEAHGRGRPQRRASPRKRRRAAARSAGLGVAPATHPSTRARGTGASCTTQESPRVTRARPSLP